MNDTEQLIKEALGKLAERTPHPGPTLNALRRKRKRHRNVFMIAAAGVAAAAVLIVGGLAASSGYQPPGHNDAAAALVGEKGSQGVDLKYKPHWLPGGFVEAYRGTGDAVDRTWVPAGAKGYPFTDGGPLVKLFVATSVPDTAGWDEVTVRGLKGWVHTKQGQSAGLTAEVVWQAQQWLGVTVRGVADVRDAALRVADSVRSDAKVVHKAPFSLNGADATQVWGGSPTDWGAQLIASPIVAEVSTRAPGVSGGTPVTVRGKQGVVVDGAVVVQDGPVWVSVRGDVPTETLVKNANELAIAPAPDMAWIGRGI